MFDPRQEDADYDFYARYDYLSEAYGAEARQLDEQNAREGLYLCAECGDYLPVGVLQPEQGPATKVCSDACEATLAEALVKQAEQVLDAETARRENFLAYGQQGADALYAADNGGVPDGLDLDLEGPGGCPF
jgi:hypothetical protein